MNKAILIGNLTRDPEVSTTANGVTLCKFSIAVQRPFANASGEREADFFNIVVWRGLADNCGKYLLKGNKVCVSGSIQTRTYDGTDGTKRYAFDIVADDVEFLTPKNSGGNEQSYEPRAAAPQSQPKKKVDQLKPIEDDGLPF